LPPSSQQSETYAEPWLRKSWFAAVTALVGAIAGALGSIFSEDLKGSIPFEWAIKSWAVLGFWFLLALFGSLFGGVQWAHLRANARSHHELSTLVGDLMSLPPGGFLQAFSDLYESSEAASFNAINAPNQTNDHCEETLRMILTSIATLAMLYHDDSDRKKRPRYAANIMLYKELQYLSPKEKQAVQKRLWLFEGEPDKCFGALDLIKEFSSSTSKKNEEDDFIKEPFAFPVPYIDEPLDDKKIKKSQLLPGAPWAFITKEFHSFLNPEELIAFVEQKMDFRPTTKNDFIQKLVTYFSSPEGQMVKSFISIPIPPPDFAKNSKPIGILNIHRDTPDMFKDKGNRLFPHLIHPFLGILSRLLNHHESKT